MIVLGYRVPPAVEAKLVERMRSGPFTANQLADTADRLCTKAPNNSVGYRLADRLIQRERKAGHIIRAGKGWVWR